MYWTIHLEGGPLRVNHAAVAVDSKIYSFGGYSSSEGYEVTGKIDIYALNTCTFRWKPVIYSSFGDEVPFKRYGHTVVAHGRKIYLWGGRNELSASNILHCFDVDKLTWSLPHTTGRIPLAVDGHSACVIKDHMYVFGGFQEDTERFGNTLHRVNLITFEWEEVLTFGETPASRDFHTASAIGNRMYIFGGRSSSEEIFNELKSEFYCNKIMYLNTNTMLWVKPKTKGVPPCGRRSHSAVVLENKIYIVGGYNGISQNHLNDVFQFDPVENEWTRVTCQGKGPCPRRRHCACVVGKEMFLFGGSSPRIEDDKVSPSSVQDFQKLIDHSDLHVLDFFPSLKRLCQLKVIEYGLNFDLLPKYLIKEISFMTTNNIITQNDFFPRKDFGVFSFSA